MQDDSKNGKKSVTLTLEAGPPAGHPQHRGRGFPIDEEARKKCISDKCTGRPAFMAEWPGQGVQHYCAECAIRAQNIGAALGFTLVLTAFAGNISKTPGEVAHGWMSPEDILALETKTLVVMSFKRTTGATFVFLHPKEMSSTHADAVIVDMITNPMSPLFDAKGSYVCQLILSGDHVLLRYDPV